MRTEIIIAGLITLFTAGCNTFQTGACESLQKTLCDTCNVDSVTEDTVCACLEEGEVDNADRYFESEDDAEQWCFRTKQEYSGQYLTTEEVAQCRQETDLFKEFDDQGWDDACEEFGYESDGDGDDDWTPDADADTDADADADADADSDSDSDADADADADADVDDGACNFEGVLCIQFTGPDWSDTSDWCSYQGGNSVGICDPDAHSACDIPAGGDYQDTALAYYYDGFPMSSAEDACESVGGTYIEL